MKQEDLLVRLEQRKSQDRGGRPGRLAAEDPSQGPGQAAERPRGRRRQRRAVLGRLGQGPHRLPVPEGRRLAPDRRRGGDRRRRPAAVRAHGHVRDLLLDRLGQDVDNGGAQEEPDGRQGAARAVCHDGEALLGGRCPGGVPARRFVSYEELARNCIPS